MALDRTGSVEWSFFTSTNASGEKRRNGISHPKSVKVAKRTNCSTIIEWLLFPKELDGARFFSRSDVPLGSHKLSRTINKIWYMDFVVYQAGFGRIERKILWPL